MRTAMVMLFEQDPLSTTIANKILGGTRALYQQEAAIFQV